LKPKTAAGGGTGDDPLELLHQRAEKLARERTARGLEEDLTTLPPAAAQRLLHDLQVHQIELELQNEELRQTQDALEASRLRYFDLYNLAPVGYFTLDDQGFIIEANLTGATLLGVARGALATQSLSRFVAAEDADNYYLYHRHLLKTGTPQAFELRMVKQGGTSFTAWVESSVAVDAGGHRICRKVVSDITEHKAIQEKLRQSQNLLHVAGEMALMGGWAIQLPGNALMWSDEICTILDFPKGSVPPLAVALALYPLASREIISGALESCARDGTPFDCELEIVTAKRRQLHVRAIGKPVRDSYGNITAIEGAFQDITGRKKIEQENASLAAQLRESQKMEAIGTLAGGIAHDFNNILGAILGNVHLARQDAATNWQALVSLEEIQKAGHRGRDLVQQILAFSRRQPTARRQMLLGPVVEESVRMLRATLSGGMQIECHCAADTPLVVADPTQVQQVVLNIGINAAHAMEDRPGVITIRVEHIMPGAVAARFDSRLPPGEYVRVMISDTGIGMSAEIQRRIFEPFFTTKPMGKGTGLGLSVAYGIMQAHDGVIIVHSEPGKGSRFELYFPCARAVAAARDATEIAGQASEGRGRHVLYIDDDETQLFMFQRTLERWGYRVSAYLAQRDALVAVRGGEHFDLVVTDFNMPGVSGLEVAQAVRDAQPDLPVIMVSGYITDTLRAQAAAAGVCELISKSHEVEDLRDAISRQLMRLTH